MARRSLILSLSVCLVALAGCGSSGIAAPQTAPVWACSLLTLKEAASVFPVSMNDRLPPNSKPVLDQTACNYFGSQGQMLLATVSWYKKSVASFTRGFSRPEPSTSLPQDEFVARPVYTPLMVDGVMAYWLSRTPYSGSLPTSGVAVYPSNMTAMKHGYVVTLNSTGLSEAQDAKAIGVIIRGL